jgi:hypothetical protein
VNNQTPLLPRPYDFEALDALIQHLRISISTTDPEIKRALERQADRDGLSVAGWCERSILGCLSAAEYDLD